MTDVTDYEAVDFDVSRPPALEAWVADAEVPLAPLLVRSVKRSVDFVIAGTLLLILLPVVVAVAILVRLDSPGPSFFRCDRVGFRARRLRMLKFRKMVSDAHGPPLTTASDDRFTRIGRFLSKYKVDELPQLWHVLVGEMSIIGPRPETSEFVERYAAEFYGTILRVRPGVVGLSQVAFVNESAILDPTDPVRHYVERLLPQKVALDTMYARDLSIRRDMAIFFWAFVTVVLRRPVDVNRQTGAMNLGHRKHGPRTEPRQASYKGDV